MGAVFGSAPAGYAQPFSFKKLARKAAHEMESAVVTTKGAKLAPALFTILVSANDDSLMRPLYEQITFEIANLLGAQARKKSYTFVGNPLIRFMVDPSLKSGKFVVFAENVDADTLARLRREEQVFLSGSSSMGGAAAHMQRHTREEAPLSVSSTTAGSYAESKVSDDAELSNSAGLHRLGNFDDFDRVAVESMSDAQNNNASSLYVPVASTSESTPMPILPQHMVASHAASSNALGVTPSLADEAPNLVPPTVRRASLDGGENFDQPVSALWGSEHNQNTANKQDYQPQQQALCILVDRRTGQTYSAHAPEVVIGRERSLAQIVLRDPNVSRRHARLLYDGAAWHIQDLGSTNGTLVNEVDIQECVLRSGDLITFGLVNLEFREIHA